MIEELSSIIIINCSHQMQDTKLHFLYLFVLQMPHCWKIEVSLQIIPIFYGWNSRRKFQIPECLDLDGKLLLSQTALSQSPVELARASELDWRQKQISSSLVHQLKFDCNFTNFYVLWWFDMFYEFLRYTIQLITSNPRKCMNHEWCTL